jgi:general secretion pathway protein M
MDNTMGNPSAAPAGALAGFIQRLAPVQAFWAGLSPRDRRLLAVAAAALAFLLVWLLAVQPAWRTLRDAPAQLEVLDTQLQTMQRLAGEARELRAAPPLGTAQSALALKAASDRLGEKGRLAFQGERAVLTLNGAPSEALRSWLNEARAGARARPVEAQLSRGPQGFNGTVTVAVGGAQ